MSDPNTTVALILLLLALTFVCGALFVRQQNRKARKQEQRAAWSKVKEWEDEDDEDDDWGKSP